MFSSNKSQKSTSRSKKSTSAVHDGRMSFSSDTSTLLNVGLPLSGPKSYPKYDDSVVVEMIDEEDQAWGAPPTTAHKWSLPIFSRKSRPQSS